MSLYYADEHVTLYHGNCLTEHREWLTADVLVTDPPYGRNWRQGELHDDKHTGIAGDKDTTVRDVALGNWGGVRPVVAFGDLMLAPPVGTKQVLVYVKPVDAGVRGAMAGFRRDTEAVYLINRWPTGIGGDSSVLRTGARMVGGPVGLATRARHPHAKPLDVMQRLIGLTSGVIADPFAGSGSTLSAATLSGRKAIGVELEEPYCEIIAKRLTQGALDFTGGVA